MAAAGDQAQERRLERIRAPGSWPRRGRGGGRPGPAGAGARRRAPWRCDPDEQRRDQAGTARDRDQLDVARARTRRSQRVVDHGADQLEVVTRGDLRDDSAVAAVDALGGDHVRADRPVRRDDRRARVVAAGLEREDHPAAPVPEGSSRGPPHDQGVLARVVVVARPRARRAKPEPLVQRDRGGFEVRTSSVYGCPGPRARAAPRAARGHIRGAGATDPRRCSSGARRRRSASRSGSRRSPASSPGPIAARHTPDGFESSSTNIASDHGVGNARRSIAITCGRSE